MHSNKTLIFSHLSFPQTSVEFLRIRSHSGADVINSFSQHQHGDSSHYVDIVQKEGPRGELGNLGPGAQSSFERNESEMDTTLQKLRAQLEGEREKSQRLSAELAQEIEKHQHAITLLEEERKGREEERQDREAQLQDLQSQLDLVQTRCLEMQHFKAEKEKLNREVQDLKQKLEMKEDAERRLSEEVRASSALHDQILEKEIKKLKEEHLKEMEGVRQLLDAREVEVKGLKDSKNRHNQAKAGFSCDEGFNRDDSNLESESDQASMNVSVPGDVLMERYLSAALPEQSQSFAVNESFEHYSQADISADNRLVKH